MQFDIDAPAMGEPVSGVTERLDIRSLFVDTVRRPAAAMRRLTAEPGRRWLAPLLALVVLSVAATATSLPAREQYAAVVGRAQLAEMVKRNPEMFQGRSVEEMSRMSTAGAGAMVGRVMALVGAVFAPVVAALAGAAVLHFLGTLLGGQQAFTQMLAVTAWGRVPLMFQYALRSVGGLLGLYDPNPDGLAGLVAGDPLKAFARPSPLAPLLAQVSVWNLWMLVLFLIAVRIVCHVSARKALVAVAVYVALAILLGEVGVGFGSIMAGFSQSVTGG